MHTYIHTYIQIYIGPSAKNRENESKELTTLESRYLRDKNFTETFTILKGFEDIHYHVFTRYLIQQPCTTNDTAGLTTWAGRA